MSIKANELRVGNYFEHEGKYWWLSEIRHLINVKEWSLKGWYEATKERKDINFFDANPLPLTPEILEKAGFVKHDGMYLKIFKSINSQNTFCINEIGQAVEESGRVVFKERFGFCYTLEYSHIAVESEYIVYVDSLHQLQNLYFALTGEELIVKF